MSEDGALDADALLARLEGKEADEQIALLEQLLSALTAELQSAEG